MNCKNRIESEIKHLRFKNQVFQFSSRIWSISGNSVGIYRRSTASYRGAESVCDKGIILFVSLVNIFCIILQQSAIMPIFSFLQVRQILCSNLLVYCQSFIFWPLQKLNDLPFVFVLSLEPKSVYNWQTYESLSLEITCAVNKFWVKFGMEMCHGKTDQLCTRFFIFLCWLCLHHYLLFLCLSSRSKELQKLKGK